jgi:hypothetical protein
LKHGEARGSPHEAGRGDGLGGDRIGNGAVLQQPGRRSPMRESRGVRSHATAAKKIGRKKRGEGLAGVTVAWGKNPAAGAPAARKMGLGKWVSVL